MLPRILYAAYVVLRVGEAGEIGHVCYLEAQNPFLAASLVFAFMFGLAVVLAGVHKLGEHVAVAWHVVLELMLAPLSVYFAMAATTMIPPAESVLSKYPSDARFVVMLVLFFTAQGLLALAGLHIVKWLSKEEDSVRRSQK